MLAVVVGGAENPGLQTLLEAAFRGTRAAGGEFFVGRPGDEGLTERVLLSDALLLATPVVLLGLPGPLKTWLDSWLELLPQGRLTPRTASMHAGYLAVYAPDDPAIAETFHLQMRGLFDFLGMTFRGKAAGFLAPGAAAPADASLVHVAERLGAVLCGEEGYAGYPDEYLAGIARFNAGEFWEAHEDWEEIWLEAEDGYRLYFQGLIQIAAAFHHHGNENWGGMASLFRDGIEKLDAYRPHVLGLDVDAFLDELAPWRVLAEARAGRRAPVVRIPNELPRIRLDAPGARSGTLD